MTLQREPELVYWASNSMPHHILDRAEAVGAGGYAAMSCMVGDLAAWEESGRSIAELRRELDARDVRVTTIDPYLAWYPGFDPERPTGVAAKHREHLVMTEEKLFRWAEALGATFVSTLGTFDGPAASFDEAVDALGGFADRAAAHGIRPHLEQIPTTKVHDLDAALAFVRAVDRPNLGLLLDTYNLGRAGVAPEELEAVPLELVFQLQLADGAGLEDGVDYFDDAFHRRALPGHGSFPAAEMIAALARQGPLPPCGPEVLYPQLHALAPREAGLLAAAATRRFLRDVFALAGPQPMRGHGAMAADGPVIKHVDDEPWGSAERFGFGPGPECRVYDDGSDVPGHMTILGRFPAGFVEPRHVHHDLDHWCVIVDGEMHVAGEVLTAGDYFYAPVDVPHGPLSYPVGCTVFVTVRGTGFAHDFDADGPAG